MKQGICVALVELGKDEGTVTALAAAERWHLVLEDMAQIANDEQRQAVNVLFNAVSTAIGLLRSSPR